MPASNTLEPRIAISLRLPRRVVDQVLDYALSNCVSKTDAFLHYLETGIGADKTQESTIDFEKILSELADIKNAIESARGPSDGRILPLSTIKQIVDEAAKRHPSISSIVLFGSYARGTASPTSDIDLRLNLRKNAKFNLHDLEHFAKYIEQRTGKEVDVITARSIKSDALRQAIEQDGVQIYEHKE